MREALFLFFGGGKISSGDISLTHLKAGIRRPAMSYGFVLCLVGGLDLLLFVFEFA
jgi:hypothetical protein